MSTGSFADVEFVVHTIAQTAVDNEKYFGDLDSVAGDGDFGFSLARGFEIVLADWDNYDRSDIGTFLQKIAMVITGRIGGTSGPIWGTAFLRAATKTKGRTEIGGADVVEMLRSAMEGIMARGKAELGDKTLLDALDPMTTTIAAGHRERFHHCRDRRGGGRVRQGCGGRHHLAAGPARPRVLHRRAQHRVAGPGCRGGRRHARTDRRHLG